MAVSSLLNIRVHAQNNLSSHPCHHFKDVILWLRYISLDVYAAAKRLIVLDLSGDLPPKWLQARCSSSVVANSMTIGETKGWNGLGGWPRSFLVSSFHAQAVFLPPLPRQAVLVQLWAGDELGMLWAGICIQKNGCGNKALGSFHEFQDGFVSSVPAPSAQIKGCLFYYLQYFCADCHWPQLNECRFVVICVSDDDQTAVVNVIPTVKI